MVTIYSAIAKAPQMTTKLSQFSNDLHDFPRGRRHLMEQERKIYWKCSLCFTELSSIIFAGDLGYLFGSDGLTI